MSATQEKALQATRETAAEWIVRLGASEVTAADKVAFAGWLRQSPIHVKEYLRAEATWGAIGRGALQDTSDIDVLLRSPQTNIVDLSPQPSASSVDAAAGGNARFRSWHWAAAAAVIIAVAVFLAPHFIERLDRNIYSTGVGEQRRVVIADGTAIELNTNSKVRVDIDARHRDIHLLAGEAFFDVAKDPARAFRVFSARTVVRALGTQFNVYRRPDGTVVSVVEGRIAVHRDAENSAAAPVEIELTASQQIQVAATAPMAKETLDLRKAVAWRERHLIFEDEPLSTVIAEFNRYNAQQLAIEDPALAAERISGVFEAGKPRALIRFLEQGGDVRVTARSSSHLLLSRP